MHLVRARIGVALREREKDAHNGAEHRAGRKRRLVVHIGTAAAPPAPCTSAAEADAVGEGGVLEPGEGLALQVLQLEAADLAREPLVG